MDRVGRLDPLLVVRLGALRRKFRPLRAVELVELAGHLVTRHELLLFDNRLEEAAADDLEPFLSACRSPR